MEQRRIGRDGHRLAVDADGAQNLLLVVSPGCDNASTEVPDSAA